MIIHPSSSFATLSVSASLLPLLATFALIHSPPMGVEAKSLCTVPPSWAFYDIVQHLAAINLTDPSGAAATLVSNSSNDSSTIATVSSGGDGQANSSLQYPIQFLYNANQTILEDVLVRDPIAECHREPFRDVRGNVTLIVFTNLNEHRLRSEQQIYNLEQIYKSLIGVHLKNIRFILINSRESFNPRWVWETRKRVSFEVYQELPASPVIGTLLEGGNGDIFIYDR